MVCFISRGHVIDQLWHGGIVVNCESRKVHSSTPLLAQLENCDSEKQKLVLRRHHKL